MELFFGLLTACQPDIAHDPSAVPLDVVREAARQALERTGQSEDPPPPPPPTPPAPPPLAPPPPPQPPQAEAAAQGAAASSGSSTAPEPKALPSAPLHFSSDQPSLCNPFLLLKSKAPPVVPPDAVQPWAIRPGKRGRSSDLSAEEVATLREEQQLAEDCGMTWAERGPAEGQVENWRGQAWRAGSQRYANRGGKNREYYRDLARRGLLKK